MDLATAAPLVAAFSEFLSDDDAWKRYDELSFRDLCTKLGVSRKLYREAFEPMILTGLFAPGEQCSAAAALGMAYFFVLKSQTAFDVRCCVEIKILRRVRVVLHAIDATLARWRGVVACYRSFQPTRPRSRRELLSEVLSGAPDSMIDLRPGALVQGEHWGFDICAVV